LDVVLLHLVDVASDRDENEVVDVVDALEPAGDRVRLAEIEPDTSGVAADLLRGSLRAGLIPAGHDHLAALVGVRPRELAAHSLRAADDDDAAVCHSLSFRAVDRSPARARQAGPEVRPI